MIEEEIIKTTWEGGHALVVEYGDCEFYGRCQCGAPFGHTRPDESWETKFGLAWERHTILEVEA